MTSAITGEAASINSGSTIAKAKMFTAAARFTFSKGDDNNTTGSKVIADIDHSGSRSARAATATSAASKSGAAKATTSIRRSGAPGANVSLIAATLGSVASAPSTIGAAISPNTLS